LRLGRAAVETFNDGEIHVQIGENIRGADVFIINSTSPPVNRHLMELLILIDAARRASAQRFDSRVAVFWVCRPRPAKTCRECRSRLNWSRT